MAFTRLLLAACAAAIPLLAAGPARAEPEAYPGKAIRIIVPFSAGGVVDSIARIVGAKLSARYGQPVIVENKVGAGGSIGTDFVARSTPDGYTLLAVSPGHAVAPSLIKGVAWAPFATSAPSRASA
jgi:tripartite-type tricarboxylate transporter receptor subunit TctC